MAEIKSTCCYCGVGCGVIIETDGKAITGVRGDPEHPANLGRLCTKGSTLHLTALPETRGLRALAPELRHSRGEARLAATWDAALDLCADRFAAAIREHGPDSVAFYGSGQWLTEDYYVFNKLMKGLIGSNNLDTNSRLCMSSAVTGYKATLGADAVPCNYEDVALADCLFIAGSNTAWAHPVLFRRIEDAKKAKPEMKIIVADPRRTDTAELADLFLPILPGSDVALFNGMLHVLLWEGLTDNAFIREHTEGFDTLKDIVREYTPAAVAELCGIPAADVVAAARLFGESANTLSLYCQGLNQSAQGTDKNAALIHLHLATGKIGKPGCGPFSLTGQPNAMGGREVGGMANLLSAHRDLGNPEHRAEVAKLWGVDSVPEKPGLTAIDLFDAVREGKIKALWIACTNPAQSLPDQKRIHEALTACDFVVLQEAYRDTDTADYADVLLPAAAWGEKNGTVTNSERRITRVQPAVSAPGEARADWMIGVDFAQRLGQQLDKADLAARMFPYATAEDVFNEHRESTRGRDLDITGLSYGLLETQGPQQWPFREGDSTGGARLYTDFKFATPSGRARFKAVRHAATAENIDARHPLRLTTGRLRDQWHGMSRTGTVARLFNHAPAPAIELHPRDMERRNLADGMLVRVKSRRDSIVVQVKASETLRPGVCFMPMHWGKRFASNAGANALTTPANDPISRQPELKHAAVQVEKYEAPWRLTALVRLSADQRELTRTLQPWLERFAYATLTLAGRDHAIAVLRAWGEPLSDEALAQLDADLGLATADALRFADARRGIAKRARIVEHKLLAVRLAGEVAAEEWITELMARDGNTTELRRWLLAPVAQPPAGGKGRGKIVCNCFDVSEDEIRAEFSTGLDLAALQEKRKCGTSCGSCVPELKRLAAACKQAA